MDVDLVSSFHDHMQFGVVMSVRAVADWPLEQFAPDLDQPLLLRDVAIWTRQIMFLNRQEAQSTARSSRTGRCLVEASAEAGCVATVSTIVHGRGRQGGADNTVV